MLSYQIADILAQGGIKRHCNFIDWRTNL